MKIYTGKKLEEVLQNAASDLNIKEKDVMYKIIQTNEGFLGIGSKVSIEVYTQEDIISFITSYIKEYGNHIQMPITTEIKEKDGCYLVAMDCEHNAVLIGKNGHTLQSLNLLVKAAVSSTFKRRISVLLDVQSYKEMKYQKVCLLAQRVAKTVQRTKIDATLDPMPADERKAIHQHLTTFQNISTESEGEGLQRHLVIKYKQESK